MTSRISKICVLALFLFSCGGNAATSVTISSEVESVSTGIDGGSGTVYDSSYQDAILEDGVVSYSEYRRAKLDVVSCMEQKGYEAFLDESSAPIQLIAVYGGLDGEDDGEAQGRDDYSECHGKYSNRVEGAYLSAISYEDFYKTAALFQLECIEERGHKIGAIDGLDAGDLMDMVLGFVDVYPELATCYIIGKERALEEWETRIP